MSIELPPALAKLFGVVAGSDWPQANEDGLRAVGDLYDASAADFAELEQLFVSLVNTIDSQFEGDAARRFVQSVQQYVSGDDFIGKAQAGALELGETARSTATEVEYAKWMIIAQLAELLAELLFLDATSWFNPFAAIEEAAAILATRLIVQRLIRELVQAIITHTVMEVAIGAAMDRIVQAIQILQGNRKGFDNSKLVQTVESGMLSGLAGGLGAPAFKSIGKKFGDGLGDAFGKAFSDLPVPSKIGRDGPPLGQDLANTVNKHRDSFGNGFTSGGKKDPAKIHAFADDVADDFGRNLGGQLGRDEARDLGRDYANSLASSWGSKDFKNVGDDIRTTLGGSLPPGDVRALAHDIPSTISRGAAGNALGKDLGGAAAEAVHEGMSEYLGNGFYGLIFDPSHTFDSDFGAFGGAALSSMLSHGGHHLKQSALDLSGLSNLPSLPSPGSLFATPTGGGHGPATVSSGGTGHGTGSGTGSGGGGGTGGNARSLPPTESGPIPQTHPQPAQTQNTQTQNTDAGTQAAPPPTVSRPQAQTAPPPPQTQTASPPPQSHPDAQPRLDVPRQDSAPPQQTPPQQTPPQQTPPQQTPPQQTPPQQTPPQQTPPQQTPPVPVAIAPVAGQSGSAPVPGPAPNPVGTPTTGPTSGPSTAAPPTPAASGTTFGTRPPTTGTSAGNPPTTTGTTAPTTTGTATAPTTTGTAAPTTTGTAAPPTTGTTASSTSGGSTRAVADPGATSGAAASTGGPPPGTDPSQPPAVDDPDSDGDDPFGGMFDQHHDTAPSDHDSSDGDDPFGGLFDQHSESAPSEHTPSETGDSDDPFGGLFDQHHDTAPSGHHEPPAPDTTSSPDDTPPPDETHPHNTDGNFSHDGYDTGTGDFTGRVERPTVSSRETVPTHPHWPDDPNGYGRTWQDTPGGPPGAGRTQHHLYPVNDIVDDLNAVGGNRSPQGWTGLQRIAALAYPHTPADRVALDTLIGDTMHEDPDAVHDWFVDGSDRPGGNEGPDFRFARVLGTLGAHAIWAPHNVFEGVGSAHRTGDPGDRRDQHFVADPSDPTRSVESPQSQIAGVVDLAGGMHAVATPQEVANHPGPLPVDPGTNSDDDLRQAINQTDGDTRAVLARILIDRLRQQPGADDRPSLDWSRWQRGPDRNGRPQWRHDATTVDLPPTTSQTPVPAPRSAPPVATTSTPVPTPRGAPTDTTFTTTAAPRPAPTPNPPPTPTPAPSSSTGATPHSTSTPQQDTLSVHGARIVPSTADTTSASLVDAVTTTIAGDPTWHGHAVATPTGPVTPDSVATASDVRLHVLQDDGTFTSHGPVDGVPVHVVSTGTGDGRRFHATVEDVHVGRPGVSYPGPSRDTAKDGPKAIHRGEFEIETVAGQHFVRMYTAVVDPADLSDPKNRFKDVQQDADGDLQIESGKNKQLWAGAGRPTRAIQWLAKYEHDNPTLHPALRSYLVPLDTYRSITTDAVVEGHVPTAPGAAPASETINVDQTGDANQFGIGPTHLPQLEAAAVPGSLITYRSGDAPPTQAGDGRVLPVGRLYERLGLDPDFRDALAGGPHDPWFHQRPGKPGRKFQNSAKALDTIATTLDGHLHTWRQLQAGRPVEPAAQDALTRLQDRWQGRLPPERIMRQVEQAATQARIGAILSTDATDLAHQPDVRPQDDPAGPFPNDYAQWRANPPAPPGQLHTRPDGTPSVLDLSDDRSVQGPVDTSGVEVDGAARPAPWRAADPIVVVAPGTVDPNSFGDQLRHRLDSAGVPAARPVLLVAGDGRPLADTDVTHSVAAATGRRVWTATRPTALDARVATDGPTSGPGMLGTWVATTPDGVRSTPVLTDDGTPIGTHILPASHTGTRLLGEATTTAPALPAATPDVPRIVVGLHAGPDGFLLTAGPEGTRLVDGAGLAAHLADELPTTGPFDVVLVACDAATSSGVGTSPAQQFADALAGRGLRHVLAADGTVDVPLGSHGAGLQVLPHPDGTPGRFVTITPRADTPSRTAPSPDDGPPAPDPDGTTFGLRSPQVTGFPPARPDEDTAARDRDLAELAAIARRDGHSGAFDPAAAAALYRSVTGRPASDTAPADVVPTLRGLLAAAHAAAPPRHRLGLPRPDRLQVTDLAAAHRDAEATRPRTVPADLPADVRAALDNATLHVDDPAALAARVVATAPPSVTGAVRERLTGELTTLFGDRTRLDDLLTGRGSVEVTDADGGVTRIDLRGHVGPGTTVDGKPGTPVVKASASTPGTKTAGTATHNRTWKLVLPISPLTLGPFGLTAEAGWHFGDRATKTEASHKLGASTSHKDGGSRTTVHSPLDVTATWTTPGAAPVGTTSPGTPGDVRLVRTGWTSTSTTGLLPETISVPAGATVPAGSRVVRVGDDTQRARLVDRVLAAAGRGPADPARAAVAARLTGERLRAALLTDPTAPLRITVGDTDVTLRLTLGADPLRRTGAAPDQELGDTRTGTAGAARTAGRTHGGEGALSGGPRVPGLPKGDSVLPTARVGYSRLHTVEQATARDTKTGSTVTRTGEAGRYEGSLQVAVSSAAGARDDTLDLVLVLDRDRARALAGLPTLHEDPADGPSPLPAASPTLGLHRVEGLHRADGTPLGEHLLARVTARLAAAHPDLLPTGPRPSRRRRENAAVLAAALDDARLQTGLDRALTGRLPELPLRRSWRAGWGDTDVRLALSATLGAGERTGRRYGGDTDFTREVTAGRTAGRSDADTIDVTLGTTAGVVAGSTPGTGALSASVGGQYGNTRGQTHLDAVSHETTVKLGSRATLVTHDVDVAVTTRQGRGAPTPLLTGIHARAELVLPGDDQPAPRRAAGPIEPSDGLAHGLDFAQIRDNEHAPATVTWPGDTAPATELVRDVAGRVRTPVSADVDAALAQAAGESLTGGHSGLTGLIAPARHRDLFRTAPSRDRQVDLRTRARYTGSRPVEVTTGALESKDVDRTAWSGSASSSAALVATLGAGGRGAAGTVAGGGVTPTVRHQLPLHGSSDSGTVQVSTTSGASTSRQPLLVRSHDVDLTADVTATPLTLAISRGRESQAAHRSIPDAVFSAENLAHAQDAGRADDGLPPRPRPDLPLARPVPLLLPATGDLDAGPAVTRLQQQLRAAGADAGMADLFDPVTSTRSGPAGVVEARAALVERLTPQALRASRRRLLTDDGLLTTVGGTTVRARLVPTTRTSTALDDGVDVSASREVETSRKSGTSRAAATTLSAPGSLSAADSHAGTAVTPSLKSSRTESDSTTTTSTTTTAVSVTGPAVRYETAYDLVLETVGPNPVTASAPAGRLTEHTPAGLLTVPATPATTPTTPVAAIPDLLTRPGTVVVDAPVPDTLRTHLDRLLGTAGEAGLGAAALAPDAAATMLPDATGDGHVLRARAIGTVTGATRSATVHADLDTTRARVVAVLDGTRITRTTTGAVSGEHGSSAGTETAVSGAGTGTGTAGDERLGGTANPPPNTAADATNRSTGTGSSTDTTRTETRGRALLLEVPVSWRAGGQDGTSESTALVLVDADRARELGLLDADGTVPAAHRPPALHDAATAAATATAAERGTRRALLQAQRELDAARADRAALTDRGPLAEAIADRHLSDRRALLARRLQEHADTTADLATALAGLRDATGAAPSPPPAPVTTADDPTVSDDELRAQTELEVALHTRPADAPPRDGTLLDAVTASRDDRVHDAWLAADALAHGADPAAFRAAARHARTLAATPADQPLPAAWLPAPRPADARPAAPTPERAPALELSGPGAGNTARLPGDPSAGFDVLPPTGDADGEGFFHAAAAQLPGQDPAALRDALAAHLDGVVQDPADPLHPAAVTDTVERVDPADLAELAAVELTAAQRRELQAAGVLTGALPPDVAGQVVAATTHRPGRWQGAAADLWPPLLARHTGRDVLVVDGTGHALARFPGDGDAGPVVLMLRDGRWITLRPRDADGPAVEREPLAGLPVVTTPLSSLITAALTRPS